MMARNQLVLDLSNDDVHEYLYNTIAGLLRDYDIDERTIEQIMMEQQIEELQTARQERKMYIDSQED